MKRKPEPKPEEIEEHPDARERFEKAVDTVMSGQSFAQTTRIFSNSASRDGHIGPEFFAEKADETSD
jgi:hypothetical protein